MDIETDIDGDRSLTVAARWRVWPYNRAIMGRDAESDMLYLIDGHAQGAAPARRRCRTRAWRCLGEQSMREQRCTGGSGEQRAAGGMWCEFAHGLA